MDDVCREYLKGRVNREWTAFEADADAEYSRTVTINLDELDMTVSLPHLPENTQLARDCKQEIDQVVIGQLHQRPHQRHARRRADSQGTQG